MFVKLQIRTVNRKKFMVCYKIRTLLPPKTRVCSRPLLLQISVQLLLHHHTVVVSGLLHCSQIQGIHKFRSVCNFVLLQTVTTEKQKKNFTAAKVQACKQIQVCKKKIYSHCCCHCSFTRKTVTWPQSTKLQSSSKILCV